MFFDFDTLRIARNSIWRRKQKERFSLALTPHMRYFEGARDEAVSWEFRNFWDVDKSLYGKKFKLFITHNDYAESIDPLLQRDSFAHMVLNPIFGGDKLDDFFVYWLNYAPENRADFIEDDGAGHVWLLRQATLLFDTFLNSMYTKPVSKLHSYEAWSHSQYTDVVPVNASAEYGWLMFKRSTLNGISTGDFSFHFARAIKHNVRENNTVSSVLETEYPIPSVGFERYGQQIRGTDITFDYEINPEIPTKEFSRIRQTHYWQYAKNMHYNEISDAIGRRTAKSRSRSGHVYMLYFEHFILTLVEFFVVPLLHFIPFFLFLVLFLSLFYYLSYFCVYCYMVLRHLYAYFFVEKLKLVYLNFLTTGLIPRTFYGRFLVFTGTQSYLFSELNLNSTFVASQNIYKKIFNKNFFVPPYDFLLAADLIESSFSTLTDLKYILFDIKDREANVCSFAKTDLDLFCLTAPEWHLMFHDLDSYHCNFSFLYSLEIFDYWKTHFLMLNYFSLSLYLTENNLISKLVVNFSYTNELLKKKKKIFDMMLGIFNLKFKKLKIQHELAIQTNVSFNRRKSSISNLHKELEVLLHFLQFFKIADYYSFNTDISSFFTNYLAMVSDNNILTSTFLSIQSTSSWIELYLYYQGQINNLFVQYLFFKTVLAKELLANDPYDFLNYEPILTLSLDETDNIANVNFYLRENYYLTDILVDLWSEFTEMQLESLFYDSIHMFLVKNQPIGVHKKTLKNKCLMKYT